MAKFEVYVEYKENSGEIFRKTENSFKSFIRLKFGYVKNKTKELENHKGSIKNRKNKKYEIGNNQQIKRISGIFENDENNNLSNLQSYVEKLPKYSFAIWFKFKLKAPYFSKDDDEFYIIQNPILKETNFKVPMIRGSAWKGALAHAFRELINKANTLENSRKAIESFLRIFGAGSESIKTLEEYLKNKLKRNEHENLQKYKEEFLKFVLFELGLEINQELIENVNNAQNYKDISNLLAVKVWEKYKNSYSYLSLEFQTHKGRAIFYPTYFDELSLEIINPHDRRKRAGKNPIHYEVVPAGTEGIFQLIYIPFDGILKTDEELREEIQKDLGNLIEALKVLANKGVGAKTKLGWGRFEILESEKKICLDKNIELPEKPKNKGWERCQD
ncbi:protein of unknown function DUF324 [Thermovibrio ammonificans HB-1]|uniref:CRISPR type III-associated protein domain-containing protein n=1 Tax=Thermovibrio ammonificans (strain DSM 15698 / JCM 12110 / HB-1) TaxID=648996 RepID=E8T4Q4_THEA1|nr:RAMP superfamily CRISPR-associated protein [Thermovibrio ammonificans]ADU96316.1 protein of unknown function DUF324 [Thermovibrio ammonificans HB-1]